jgi:subfamily B ATP-binding cassette protein MsbA
MDKSLEIWPAYKRLLRYVKPYQTRLALGILLAVAYSGANAATLGVVKKVWSGIFEHGNQNLGLGMALAYAGLLPLVMIVRGACDFGTTYLMNWVGGRVVNDLRGLFFEHLQTLSLDYFTETKTGELISRATNDVGALQNSITVVVGDLVKQPCTLVGVVAGMVWLDWKLTLFTLVLFPLCLLPITVYGRRIRRAARPMQEHQASLVSVMHEALMGMRVVKAFGMEQREAAEFRDLCRKFFSQRMRIVRAKAISTPLIEMISGVAAAFIFLYAYRTGMPASTLVSMAGGMFLMYEPVKKLSAVRMQLQESVSAAQRVFQVLDTKPTVVESPRARVLPPLRQSLRFENVGFSYGENGAALESVNVEVAAGTVVAVVGASGAGKTTLFNLVPRFYDPTSGAVKIDGVDIREGTFKSLRDQIGLVTQETFLFNDTVGVNIAYGKPGASKEEIISAAKRAHAHEFIMQTPHGYDTVIGEAGMRLSGGQRQRLAIARAVLKNPPILLLDEATSALDTESERVVQAALDELMWGSPSPHRSGFGGAGGRQGKGHTMLVIAHRLSTVQHADRIIVLEKGRVVEEGTHEHLLARGHVYKRLYELQFQG